MYINRADKLITNGVVSELQIARISDTMYVLVNYAIYRQMMLGTRPA